MKFTRIRALVSVLVTALALVLTPVAFAHSAHGPLAGPAAQVMPQFATELVVAPSSDWQAHQWQREHSNALVLNILGTPADAASLSNYWQNKLIDFLLRAQSLTAPATVYVALDTTSGSASACGTEVTGGSYTREAVTSSLANWAGTQGAGTTVASSGTSGETSNNNAITFPAPTAAWGTIVGFCFYDASTSGNLLLYAPLTVNKTVNSGDAAPSFAAGALTWTIT